MLESIKPQKVNKYGDSPLVPHDFVSHTKRISIDVCVVPASPVVCEKPLKHGLSALPGTARERAIP